jgi:hypothetical protein
MKATKKISAVWKAKRKGYFSMAHDPERARTFYLDTKKIAIQFGIVF